MPLRNRLQPVLIMMLFAAPALAAWVAHATWQPTRVDSYGELLEPVAPSLAGLIDDQGRPASLAALRGRWVLVTVVAGACGEPCRQNIHLARQVRLAQGRDQERLVQAVIGDEASSADAIDGVQRFALPAEGLAALTGGQSARTYVLDPLGRSVLRFPGRPQGKGMIRDLQRLLRASKLG